MFISFNMFVTLGFRTFVLVSSFEIQISGLGADHRDFDAASNRALHSCSSTPPMSVHFHDGLRRTTSSAKMSICRHPWLCRNRMEVPYTTVSMPLHRMAPWHIGHGAVLWSGIETVVYGTSIRFLQSHGWRQIDILAEEVVRRSPSWQCTLIGGVLEQECNALFEAASNLR